MLKHDKYQLKYATENFTYVLYSTIIQFLV